MQDDNGRILECFDHVLPFVNELLVDDVSVCMTDCEKVLMYQPGKKFDLKIQPGRPLEPKMAAYQAIHKRERIVTRVDASLHGIPFIAVAIPIYNQAREIIGSAIVTQSVDRQDTLRQVAAALSDSISILASTTEEISAQTEEIAAVSQTLVKVTRDSQGRVQETDQVIGFIKNIAGQTNLLGLNAAIEAARVGDQGRGFGVVAQEIRKLAIDSADSIKKIDAIIKSIQADSNQTNSQTEHINAVLGEIANAITQVTAAVQEANDQARKLGVMADDLLQA